MENSKGQPRNLHNLLDALKKVCDNCEQVKYSLDDVYELLKISVELKTHASQIYECCT